MALIALAVAYYAGAQLGLIVALIASNVTPLWPCTGIAVAAFLVFGRALWPAVAIAALAVNLPISENLLCAAVTAAGNTLAPLLAVALLDKVGFRRQWTTGRTRWQPAPRRARMSCVMPTGTPPAPSGCRHTSTAGFSR